MCNPSETDFHHQSGLYPIGGRGGEGARDFGGEQEGRGIRRSPDGRCGHCTQGNAHSRQSGIAAGLVARFIEDMAKPKKRDLGETKEASWKKLRWHIGNWARSGTGK